MIDFSFLLLSFTYGIGAFFAPCAVALLPGYVSIFVTRNTDDYSGKAKKLKLLGRAIKLAFLIILGFVAIYAIAGILISFIAEAVKGAIVWISLAMGLLFVFLGIWVLIGKNISLNLHFKEKQTSSEGLEAFLFGIAYAIGALGCVFPLFLVVVFFAVESGSALIGTAYLGAYLVGMSLLMITVIMLAVFAKTFLQKSLRKLLPQMNRITGILLILAGAYVIWYQRALLFGV